MKKIKDYNNITEVKIKEVKSNEEGIQMIPLVDVKYYKKTVGNLKKETPNELTACCPLCGDKKYRNHLYASKYGKGLVFCYNGGCEINDAPVTVWTFLQLAGGDVGGYKIETLSNRISEIKNEKNIDDVLSEIKAKNQEKPQEKPQELEIPKMILDQFQKCKNNAECAKYVKQRGLEPLNDWLFSTQKFFTFNDKSIFLERYLLIPIYNQQGKFKGFYSRSIDEKRFSTFLLPDTEKIWLLNHKETPEYIFEGIFDSLSTNLPNVGAMIGADVSEEYRNELPKSTVFCFDNDKTGTHKAIKYAELGFRVFVWPDLEVKDTNELLLKGEQKNEITEMIKQNTYSGIQAITRLKMKQV